MSERDEVIVDGLRYVLTGGEWFFYPKGAPWRIAKDEDTSRLLNRIRALESAATGEPVRVWDDDDDNSADAAGEGR